MCSSERICLNIRFRLTANWPFLGRLTIFGYDKYNTALNFYIYMKFLLLFLFSQFWFDNVHFSCSPNARRHLSLFQVWIVLVIEIIVHSTFKQFPSIRTCNIFWGCSITPGESVHHTLLMDENLKVTRECVIWQTDPPSTIELGNPITPPLLPHLLVSLASEMFSLTTIVELMPRCMQETVTL